MLTRSSQQLNAVPNQTIINNMYRIANIVLFVLAIFVVMGCSCSKTLCERNIQDDILNIDKFRKQSKKEYRYIEEDAERLFANSAAVYPDTLYRQQYTSLQGYFYGETGFDLYCIWYAQFNANNRKHYRCERKTLNKIFYCVNDMLRCIAGGGTGFAHETYRIPAYTEYYIYKYQNMEANKHTGQIQGHPFRELHGSARHQQPEDERLPERAGRTGRNQRACTGNLLQGK